MIQTSSARRWLTGLCTGLLISLLMSLSALADEVFVLSEVAPVLDAPRFNATTLAEPPKGTALTILTNENNWLQVDYHGQTGWVSRWLVGTEPPQAKVTHLEGELDADEVRLRASEVTTAGAIRGLSEGETEFGGGTDYAELERMEGLQPDPNELTEFQRPLTAR
ncbi:SH3 domain-containing protein [Saccharospirillum salsuginis]|uniref:SH3b domain-containing protein n=1 Tax=Saccharospirillum salsuginis TaxID=418750 RepID=A0A918KBU9_9GAMM|nr:SH3 domain-containing protein [Saccharospirillum salsuginis]GGX58027.1 hypothetical protein GCM10007392_27180 [Saccharospirillum salsuginis]